MAAKKSKKSKKPLVHPATLKSLCPATTATVNALGGISYTAGSWFTITSTGGNPFLGWEGVIDLGAYRLKDLTWVTRSKDIQEPGNFILSFVDPQRIEIIEFISNTPFDNDRLVDIVDDWERGNAVPGMMNSTVDFQNIIDGRWRQISPDSTLAVGSALTIKASSFGSCEPSASDRLHTYCIVRFTGAFEEEGDYVFVPGRRFLLGGAAVEEREYEYIMRMRRSYVEQD